MSLLLFIKIPSTIILVERLLRYNNFKSKSLQVTGLGVYNLPIKMIINFKDEVNINGFLTYYVEQHKMLRYKLIKPPKNKRIH